MTVEPSWLIDASHWPNTLEKMKAEGALVPDTRLQTVADAWNETDVTAKRHVRIVSPRLWDLLDALTKEEQ